MIPFVDLHAQHAPLAPELEKKLRELLTSSAFILGAEVEAFEEEFARYLDVRFAVGVASGTAALQLACEALLEPGDEVILPAQTYVATALAVSAAGCRPVLVDVSDATATLAPALLEAARTRHTRAILPVHLYGHPAAMGEIRAFAARHGLRVIEDCAQAHGATLDGRRVGALGDAGCFSFYPSKNLGALGDGGMVVTDDEGVAERLRMLRHLGQPRRNVHEVRGHNERLDGLQAAFLRVKLPHLDEWNARRRAAAAAYAQALAGLDLRLPGERPGATHVYHLYVVRYPRRDEILRALEARQIGCGVYYPQPIHLQLCYRDLGIPPGRFPVAERISREGLALPMYPELTLDQIHAVADAIRSAL